MQKITEAQFLALSQEITTTKNIKELANLVHNMPLMGSMSEQQYKSISTLRDARLDFFKEQRRVANMCIKQRQEFINYVSKDPAKAQIYKFADEFQFQVLLHLQYPKHDLNILDLKLLSLTVSSKIYKYVYEFNIEYGINTELNYWLHDKIVQHEYAEVTELVKAKDYYKLLDKIAYLKHEVDEACIVVGAFCEHASTMQLCYDHTKYALRELLQIERASLPEILSLYKESAKKKHYSIFFPKPEPVPVVFNKLCQ